MLVVEFMKPAKFALKTVSFQRSADKTQTVWVPRRFDLYIFSPALQASKGIKDVLLPWNMKGKEILSQLTCSLERYEVCFK